ncbi:MAG: AraC family transcriptional regulator, partial [Pseudomonadota bacterium]
MTGPHRAYMTALLNLVKSYHVDAGTVLKGTVINPDEKITPRALSKICERAIRLTGDPALGLRYGTQVNVNNHGIVGYALMSSRTVGRAVDLLLKYNNVLAPGIEVERVTEKDECRIQCTPRRPSDLSRFFVEAFMGSLVTSLKDLLGDDASSLRVEFAGDPPVGSVDYAELASVPVRFKQSNNAVIFDAS